MKIFRIDPVNPDKKKLLLAAEALKRGKILIYPTDTVYGIGCSLKADIKKIFEIKKREQNRPLSIACHNLEAAKKYAHISQKDEEYIKKKINEPLTFVVEKKDSVPDSVTAGKKTVGFRIPDNRIIKEILSIADEAIITTSANISGEPAPKTFNEIKKEILSSADIAIDGGPCKIGKPSTVIDLKTKKILRE